MRKYPVAAAATVLTVIIFAMGYVVEFLITVLAMSLDLPGPYAESPITWVWFGISILLVFAVSLLFCRWFARTVEKRVRVERTFE